MIPPVVRMRHASAMDALLLVRWDAAVRGA